MASEPGELDTQLGVLNAIIRQLDAPDRIHGDFAGFLRERGVSGADLDAMLRVGADRFEIYRKLVHNRLRNTTREFVERTYERIGRARFSRDFARFMQQCATASPYLRDVPREFVEWVAPQWLSDPEVEDYLIDLARHELLEYDVRNDSRGGEQDTGQPLRLDKPLRFDGAARLMNYDHAVHRLSIDEDDRTIPVREPTRLLVYRDSNNTVRYLELTPYAAAVSVALMVDCQPVAAGLAAACAQLGETLDDAKLATAAHFLADLAQRRVMLGSE